MSHHNSILATTIQLNNTLFRNSLKDISKDEAHRRAIDNFAPMIFIAGHLINARYYYAKLAGLVAKRPLQDTFLKFEEGKDYGDPADMLAIWNEIADDVAPALAAMSDEEMLTEMEAHFPVSPPTVLNMITFLIQHEAYHIGQLGALRKALGHPGTSYK